MINRVFAVATVAIVALAVTGCAKAPPKCADADATNLAVKLFADQIGEFNGITTQEIQKLLAIQLPRATSYDEKIKKYSCEAKLSIAGKLELPVQYDSQLDDKNEHIVITHGLDINQRDARQIMLTILDTVSQKRGPTSASNAATQPTGGNPNFVEPSEQKLPLKGRFGEISINAEKIFLINGKPTTPLIEGNASLHVVEYVQVDGSDMVLLQNIGGAGCPALYHFVELTASGTKATKEFGTCSDLAKIAKDGKGVVVSLPGRDGDHIYTYVNGQVMDNGKPDK